MSQARIFAPSATMAPQWADYQEFERRYGHGNRVTDAAWAADDALDEYLRQMSVGSLNPSTQERRRSLRNRISNRKQTHARRREILLGRYAAGAPTFDDIDPAARTETLEALARVQTNVCERDWHLMRVLAEGGTYPLLASQFRASITSLKSRVSRCRKRLVRAQQ